MLKALARFILRISGWQIVGEHPAAPKAVIIAAPHTSNWDGFWALTYKVAIGLDIHFFAKKSLFWFPLSTLLRALGGIPLDRSKAKSAVAQAVEMFNNQESFYFGLAPEGSRSLHEGWKTGFYRIATDAGVPVYLGMVDYAKKHVGITIALELTGDIDADLQKCADYYQHIEGRWPNKTTPVRFTK